MVMILPSLCNESRSAVYLKIFSLGFFQNSRKPQPRIKFFTHCYGKKRGTVLM